eukprot:scaffold129296_cov39-Phaeocystis_antarctica.AAC.1
MTPPPPAAPRGAPPPSPPSASPRAAAARARESSAASQTAHDGDASAPRPPRLAPLRTRGARQRHPRRDERTEGRAPPPPRRARNELTPRVRHGASVGGTPRIAPNAPARQRAHCACLRARRARRRRVALPSAQARPAPPAEPQHPRGHLLPHDRRHRALPPPRAQRNAHRRRRAPPRHLGAVAALPPVALPAEKRLARSPDAMRAGGGARAHVVRPTRLCALAPRA